MLSLNIKSGEYITIGNDIVVQIFRDGADARVEIKAPKEMIVLRGKLHERTNEKPDVLFEKRPKSLSERTRNAKRVEQFAEKKAAGEVQKQQLLAIAGQLDHLSERLRGTEEQAQIKDLVLKLFGAIIGEDTEKSRGDSWHR